MNSASLIPAPPFTADSNLRPISRWPTTLAETTLKAVEAWPAAVAAQPSLIHPRPELIPRVSIVVLTHNGLAFTKLCLESIVANTDYHDYEMVIVDNASNDGTPVYLHEL